jgi:uncharacterized protein
VKELRIVLDTNIIVSAMLVTHGLPHKCLQAILTDERFILCLSDEVFEEYRTVLTRARFQKYPHFIDRVEAFFEELPKHARWFEPTEKINMLADPDDNKFLELAKEAKAHYLITGNTIDFTLTRFETTIVIQPNAW